MLGGATVGQLTGSRAQALADEFEAVVHDFDACTQAMSPEQWRMRAVNSPIWQLGEDERRPIGPIAYHTAEVIATHTAMLRAAGEGRPLPVPGGRWTIEGVAEWNAEMAERNAGVTQQQVHDLLMANAAEALDVIRGLTDEQLDRRLSDADREAVGPFNPELRTAGEIVEQCLAGHLRVHLTSFQATLGR
jgi:DinB superfamily